MNGEVINEKPLENQQHVNNNSKRLKDSSMAVSLLDDTEYKFDVEPRSKGEELLKKVNTHLNLDEPEFFGLLFTGRDDKMQYWLDPQKSIIKQIKVLDNSTKFYFRVLYYTPDPNSLQEYTRYLFTLQIRQDLLDGRLLCSEDTGALLASYIVQGELGNHDPTAHADGYLKGFNFVPGQTPEIEDKIVEYHKSHRGKSPAESDQQMLEIARKLDMYGITLYLARDHDGKEVQMTMHHVGITVYKNKVKTVEYKWIDLRKLSFKKKKVLLKLRSQAVVSYTLKNRNAAKNFWKICVNHHVFFRAQTAQPLKNRSSFRKGSKYQYSGRTKTEIAKAAQHGRRPPGTENGVNHITNEHLDISTTTSNASTTSKYRSEDEGTYSLVSDGSSFKENSVNGELTEDKYSASEKQNIIKFEHQDSYEGDRMNHSKSIENETLLSENSFTKLSLLDKLKMSEGQEDVNMNGKSTDHELEDLGRLDAVKTDTFSFEVESMLKQFNSEYGGAQSGWHITSVTTEESEDERKDEGSETEDNQQNPSEFTEVDANQVLIDLNQENQHSKQCEKTEADASENLCSERTEADSVVEHNGRTEVDGESEMQLKQKVIALYKPEDAAFPHYDSDSDASAMTVDEESSAFEDDASLPASSSSSVTSLHHNREGYLNQVRKLKSSGDVYNIAREILLTERTLVKDLEVLTVSLRNIVEKERIISDDVMKLLYDNIDPLYDYHCSLLAELEERLTLWEMNSPTEANQDNVQKIGDIMHRNMRQMKLNIQYIKRHEDILLALEEESKRSKKFAKVYKEFELSTVCYLSLNSFLLKPVQRLLYYRNMLGKLTQEYGNQHADAIDAKVAFEEVTEACNELKECRESLGNLHKLVELKRDLVGLEDLVHPKRKFIREGCLHKICRKGPQPRMFFLLSDILLYTSQGVTATNQFRARGSVPLRAIKIENGGVELHSLYAFTIVGPGDKSFIVAASSPEEKVKWMEDIQNAINRAVKESFCADCEANKMEFILNVGANISYMCASCKEEISKLENMLPDDRLLHWRKNYPPPVSIKHAPTEDDSDDEGSYTINEQFSTLDRRHAHARTISTRKVCWHRNASISMKEYTLSIENSLSGILRRKYKNTSRWQKLWVVFTNFCLYFFKNYEEDSPFASLPLIGYTVLKPSESEVHEEYAIKLQFKTHVYIFRADKEYNYRRWMEVLNIATKHSSKQARLSTRMVGRLGSVSS